MKFEIDPVISTKFKISKEDRICTAGSCFAQNLAKALKLMDITIMLQKNQKRNVKRGDTQKKIMKFFRQGMGIYIQPFSYMKY